MDSTARFVIEIPARMGSKRVRQKNLRLIDGKPMIAYAIEAAKDSGIDEVYVNTESEVIGRLAEDLGARFFRRDPALAADEVTSDIFNFDFIMKVRPDVLVMVNPVSPLVTGRDIDAAVEHFVSGGYDTLITVREERLQAFCEGRAVNFNPEGVLPMTQNIPPVQLCAWSVSIWRAATFVESYEKKGYAVFSGRLGFFPMEASKCLKVSTEEDFRMAEALMGFGKRPAGEPEYYSP